MISNVNFIINNEDLNAFNEVFEALSNKGFNLRTSLLANGSKISARASLIRSDAQIFVLSKLSLSDFDFYEVLDEFYEVNKKYNKKIFFYYNGKLDDIFDSVYDDDSLSDDIIIKADDFKESLSSINAVNNELSLLALLGYEEKNNATHDIKEDDTTNNEIECVSNETQEESIVDTNSSEIDNNSNEAKEESTVDANNSEIECESNETQEESIVDTNSSEIECESNETQEEPTVDANSSEIECEYNETQEESIVDANNSEIECESNETQEEAIDNQEEVINNSQVEEKTVILPLEETPQVKTIFNAGVEKYSEAIYEEAFHLFDSIYNYPFASYYLGYLYSEGLGVEKDEAKAFEAYLFAVNNGVNDALTVLADCYYYGLGTNKNDELAIKYYKEAADLGDEDSLLRLGNCYYYSDNFRDYKKAYDIYNTLKDKN